MSNLVSINVGLPQDVEWQGKVVRTAIWKRPVVGRVTARRLDIDGDGQGDLAGHGGEHRAVMVYQLDSYRHWQNFLQREDFTHGQFGESHSVAVYSKPEEADVLSKDYDAAGRLNLLLLQQHAVPRQADFYLCGPAAFLSELTASLLTWGVQAASIHKETFGAGPALTPGITGTTDRAPHQPIGNPGTGPRVSFTRSGLTASWNPRFSSLLEFAEACDVPVRWSCRVGVCHTCESGIIGGEVRYAPEPLDSPSTGNVLLCCLLRCPRSNWTARSLLK